MGRRTVISEALDSLKTDDIYHRMLFTLYKLKDDPAYLTLIELAYLLDNKSLNNFLSYYGGLTIKVPEYQELDLVLQALKIYEFVNMKQGTFDEALREIKGYDKQKIKEIYAKFCEVIEDYDFSRLEK